MALNWKCNKAPLCTFPGVTSGVWGGGVAGERGQIKMLLCRESNTWFFLHLYSGHSIHIIYEPWVREFLSSRLELPIFVIFLLVAFNQVFSSSSARSCWSIKIYFGLCIILKPFLLDAIHWKISISFLAPSSTLWFCEDYVGLTFLSDVFWCITIYSDFFLGALPLNASLWQEPRGGKTCWMPKIWEFVCCD